MTREEVIRLAKEAGAYWEHGDFNMPCAIRFDRESDLERFAELVAAAEREACAVVCEQSEIPFDIQVWMDSTKKQMTALVAMALATAIRARGDSK